VTGDGDREGPGDASPQGERDDRPELDVDAAFAALVAEFGRPTTGDVGPWPAAEDVDPDDDTSSADVAGVDADPGLDDDGVDAALRAARRGPRHRLPDGGDAGFGYPGLDEPDDAEERFVPPDPPPITSTDLVSRLAWLGVIGGPLFLLIAALVAHELPTLVVLAALTAFIGGFVTLVARLPRDRGDGGDDGAVV
jgi:hypothetical protein